MHLHAHSRAIKKHKQTNELCHIWTTCLRHSSSSSISVPHPFWDFNVPHPHQLKSERLEVGLNDVIAEHTQLLQISLKLKHYICSVGVCCDFFVYHTQSFDSRLVCLFRADITVKKVIEMIQVLNLTLVCVVWITVIFPLFKLTDT